MNEIIFLIADAPEGGYSARAVGTSIFTEAETLAELRTNIREAVDCHFEEGCKPGIVRLQFVREELLTP
jgi:predicted RNase H-like HicB family nuclease